MICKHMQEFVRSYGDHPVEIDNIDDRGLYCTEDGARATAEEWDAVLRLMRWDVGEDGAVKAAKEGGR